MDILMKILEPPIKGDCAMLGHKDKIVLLSISWGASASVEFGSSDSGATFGGSQVQSVSVAKYVDKTSPTFFSHCCAGKPIQHLTIELLRSGTTGGPEVFLTYTLKGVLVGNLSISDGGDRPVENIDLYFREIEMVYRQFGPQGTVIDTRNARYDITTTQAI